MLLTTDSTRVYQLLDHPREVRSDRIEPAGFPPCPDSRYKPGYDWLFVYERQIAAFLETWLAPFRYELIGEKGILCEALSNAFAHGNRKDPHKAIFVRVRVGQAGLVVEVEDCGRGFAAAKVYNGFARNQQYYLTAGNGIRLMAQNKNFGIFHSPTGTICYLFRLFSGDFSAVAEARVGAKG